MMRCTISAVPYKTPASDDTRMNKRFAEALRIPQPASSLSFAYLCGACQE